MLDENRKKPSQPRKDHGGRRAGSGYSDGTASRAVSQVAAVLDEELEASVTGGQHLKPPRVEDDQVVDKKEFPEVLARFAKGAHDLVDVISDGVSDFSSTQATKVVNRLRDDAHSTVDLLTKLAAIAPMIVDTLFQEKEMRKNGR